MSAAQERSPEMLAVVVDALHAQVCAMEVLMAAWYADRGLPVPPGLPDLAALSRFRESAERGQRQRHLSLVVSR